MPRSGDAEKILDSSPADFEQYSTSAGAEINCHHPMTRRQLLTLPAAGALLRRAAVSQSSFPGVAYRDYPRCLPDYLRELAGQAYHRRNDEIARLKTPELIQARQRWVRETFWKLAGGEFERTPLEAQKIGAFERDGYRVEKILYQSRPKFHIPANLYIPTVGVPPYPP